MNGNGDVLPYRTGVDELQRFLRESARGREAAELRALFSPKAFEGMAVAAQALGFLDAAIDAPTEAGRRFALASGDQRARLLRSAMESVPGYGGVLQELASAAPSVITLDWVQSWWATHGFGSSDSNRAEAAPVFARLLDAAGLGRFVPGRKGRPSRIEALGGAAAAPGDPTSAPRGGEPTRSRGRNARPRLTDGRPAIASLRPSEGIVSEEAPARSTERSVLRWEITAGKLITVEFPAGLTRAEKARLMRVLELLLGE